jgi:polysaccharide export outer membrane protein
MRRLLSSGFNIVQINAKDPRPRGRRWSFTTTLVLLGLIASACASAKGTYVWVDDYQRGQAVPEGYVIGVGDLLNVQVYGNDKISTKARVRSDGRISLPLLDEVQVTGKPPAQVAREIERQLKDQNLVLVPRVTVLVDEMKPLVVAVLGSVTRPGTYTLDPTGGVAEALASAGGLTEFAHKDQIYVLRKTPRQVRIRFTFGALTTQQGLAASFRLQMGDVVVAE